MWKALWGGRCRKNPYEDLPRYLSDDRSSQTRKAGTSPFTKLPNNNMHLGYLEYELSKYSVYELCHSILFEDGGLKVNSNFAQSATASSSVQQQQQHPPLASAINAVHFVPTKLSFEDGSSNYPAWKQQMLCIIQSQGLLGFIDGTNPPPPQTAVDATTAAVRNPDYDIWSRTDVLLKGWILCSLNDDIVNDVLELKTSRDV
ncbi:hypothetical protein Sango_1964900 [Sesamum angolense]|uniref:Retrotransposon Copia-like N-terminal domain-containing protein n=1 Tax=Sesamum angolense TaxID=2727404 RepID=A0AAE1WEM0_9LAMI|nr:hypothetical protein Sango_1964900 [Sesamum angolense]